MAAAWSQQLRMCSADSLRSKISFATLPISMV